MEIVRLSEVFVPGKLPKYTYNPRNEFSLELELTDYLEELGAILTIAGPTKSGKTVLVDHVVESPIWVDGQGLDDVSVFWERVGDDLGVYTSVQTGSNSNTTSSDTTRAGVDLKLISGDVTGSEATSQGNSHSYGVQRPLHSAVKDALIASKRCVIIDDFHFISNATQKEIVRAIKPLALKEVPIILIAISHRIRDVVTVEQDMRGRVRDIEVPFWGREELILIARTGFEKLNLSDDGDRIAQRLAAESYGSPFLMQTFCRSICKINGFRETQVNKSTLVAPESWDDFFKDQLDKSAEDWFERLLRGPQERGSGRNIRPTTGFDRIDIYGLTLVAICEVLEHSGGRMDFRSSEIIEIINRISEDTPPAPHEISRVLNKMTEIAAKRSEPVDYGANENIDIGEHVENQPVLEFKEDGPNSKLYLADPFFAFYVRWGGKENIKSRVGQ